MLSVSPPVFIIKASVFFRDVTHNFLKSIVLYITARLPYIGWMWVCALALRTCLQKKQA